MTAVMFELETLGQGMDLAALRSIVDERRFSDEFKALIAERDRARDLRIRLDEEIEILKGNKDRLEKAINRGKDEGEVAYALDNMDAANAAIREASERYRDAYYALRIATGKLEEYKDVTAQYVARMNEILGDPGTAYTGNTLGHCVEVASYESGSREWLIERQGGIGGSDVGAMLRVDPDFDYENWVSFLSSKVDDYTDEEIQAQADAHAGFTGPTGRGNAWEPEIIREFIRRNPDENVMYSKASWADSRNPHYKANVDGLLSSDGIHPDGILEIKTASDIHHWIYEDEDLGTLEVVPAGYRAQVLWYLQRMGFRRAKIVALVDDCVYVEREIFADDFIDPTPKRDKEGNAMRTLDGAVVPRFTALSDYNDYIEKTWQNEVVARREGTYKGRTPARLKADFNFNQVSRNFLSVAHNLAGWSGMDEIDARNTLKKALHSGGDTDAEVVALFQKHANSCQKDRVYVDIETSGASPRMGEIIEIGIVRVAPDGEVKFSMNERFDLRDDEVRKYVGTGFEELHHISREDIEGKRRFTDPDVQAIMQEHLNDPNTVMIAHNESYEKRWFNQFVPGFQENHDRFTTKMSRQAIADGSDDILGNPYSTMDTMFLSKYLLHSVTNNKLEQFAEGNGIAYSNAHNAYADTVMTMEAEQNFKRSLLERPYGFRIEAENED